MGKKILHLVTDELFTDYAIRQFSAPEMCSEFILIPSNGWTFEKMMSCRCRIVTPCSEEFQKLLDSLNQYCAIVLHGMHWPGWQIPLLKAVPSGVKIAWVFWGGELYGQPDVSNTFLAPLDKFLNTIHTTRRKLMGKNRKELGVVPKDYFEKIDYCLTALPIEYEFAQKYLNKYDMKYLWYNYYSIEETLGSVIDKQCYGANIWIGNSATIECNYFDLLFKLRKINIGNRDLIVPLSYGFPWIMKRVPIVYRKIFGDKFKPLMNLLPRNEYNAQMLSCSIMIQPQYQAQGIGNILTGLWLGMRLYVSEKGMTYHYLKHIGVIFFTIENDLRNDNPDMLTPLSQEAIEHNRKMLLKETGIQRTIEANKQLVEELIKD